MTKSSGTQMLFGFVPTSYEPGPIRTAGGAVLEADQRYECPQCHESFLLRADGHLKVGDHFDCDECCIDLEIVSVDPLEVETGEEITEQSDRADVECPKCFKSLVLSPIRGTTVGNLMECTWCDAVLKVIDVNPLEISLHGDDDEDEDDEEEGDEDDF